MTGAVNKPAERMPSIDILRGLVMAVMALDHVRDYFHIVRTPYVWMDPDKTTFGMFFTRWLTHFCAPAFFLLAGIGAYLSFSKGKDRGPFARFLFCRGLFLVILDLVVVRLGWDFNFSFLQEGPWFIVLSTLGLSMMILAGLIFLPMPIIAMLALVVIGGHNMLDRVETQAWGIFEPLLIFLHRRQRGVVGPIEFYVSYPLLPWVGIMALGFVLGPILRQEGAKRRRDLVILGLTMVLAFILLRAFNIYGDPRPWNPTYSTPLANFMAFLRTKKYPASLQYCLMTLGPLLLLLAWLDGKQLTGRAWNWLVQLGRAPLFFYLLHIYVIHGLAVVVGWILGFSPTDFLVLYGKLPEKFGFELPVVYVVWFLVLVLCYPVCLWFLELKRRTGWRWLAYF